MQYVLFFPSLADIPPKKGNERGYLQGLALYVYAFKTFLWWSDRQRRETERVYSQIICQKPNENIRYFAQKRRNAVRSSQKMKKTVEKRRTGSYNRLIFQIPQSRRGLVYHF
jgi:hypothetical protein